jgi:transcriptional regulator with XRE-family HTH domain
VKRFDSKALYAQLDAEREKRHLSWREVSLEIGVSVSTIVRTQKGGRMEVDGMLAMVAWLNVPVETFVQESEN